MVPGSPWSGSWFDRRRFWCRCRSYRDPDREHDQKLWIRTDIPDLWHYPRCWHFHLGHAADTACYTKKHGIQSKCVNQDRLLDQANGQNADILASLHHVCHGRCWRSDGNSANRADCEGFRPCFAANYLVWRNPAIVDDDAVDRQFGKWLYSSFVWLYLRQNRS